MAQIGAGKGAAEWPAPSSKAALIIVKCLPAFAAVVFYILWLRALIGPAGILHNVRSATSALGARRVLILGASSRRR